MTGYRHRWVIVVWEITKTLYWHFGLEYIPNPKVFLIGVIVIIVVYFYTFDPLHNRLGGSTSKYSDDPVRFVYLFGNLPFVNLVMIKLYADDFARLKEALRQQNKTRFLDLQDLPKRY